ncbi:MAG: response regulator [Candidatus Woesebacteria bacterium]|jgi:DNA-binding response OmpR family regulator
MQKNSSASKTQTKKLLLIEDDVMLVNMYKAKFVNEGYEIESATDGKNGLALVPQVNPDLVILDLMLPRLSGIEVLEELKKDEKLKNIPVVVLTNLSEEKETQKALELGADGYLVKADLTPSQLVEKIKEYI